MSRRPGGGQGPVEPAWLAQRLGEAARDFRVELEPVAVDRLARYANLLLQWNRRINLTGASGPEELAEQHVADALALTPHLPPGPTRLLDVGSGAGLPGVVLAILRPNLGVTLLEPSQKRAAFLAAVRRELALRNLGVRRERVEEHRSHPDFEPYEVAVSRATWPLEQWLEIGRRLVRPGGRVLGLEGERRATLPESATRHPYRVGPRRRAVIVLDVPAPEPRRKPPGPPPPCQGS